MKWRALLLIAIGVAGCVRPSGLSSLEEKQKAAEVANAELRKQQEEALRKLKARIAQLEAEIAEVERVKSLPPFENALEPAGCRRISRVCMVEKSELREVSLVENLAGRVPSDVDRYVPGDQPPGCYLVGSLAPLNGYSMEYGLGHEERFCLSLTEGRDFIEGEGVSKRLALAEVKNRVKSSRERPARTGR